MFKHYKNQKGITQVLILISVVGLITFLLISSTFTFKKNLFANLFPKQASFAASSAADPRYAIAGGGEGNATLSSYYYYVWDRMSWDAQSQPAAQPNHAFAWMVGKADNRQDGLSCNPCTKANFDAIFNAEQPKIQTILGNSINLGGTWLVGNEANKWPAIDPAVYAYEYKKYRSLIKSLDPTAQIVPSGLVYNATKRYSDNTDPVIFTGNFLANLQPSEYPDLYNIHLYAAAATSSDSDNISQAKTYRNYIDGKAGPGKAIWVTELGVPESAATTSRIQSYMKTVIFDGLAKNNSVQKWFWFIGPSSPGFEPVALMDQNKNLTPAGNYYVSLSKGVVPSIAPTPVPDTTPPTVSITAPADGAKIPRNTNFTITANATDNVAVAKVEFVVNGGVRCTDTAAPYACITVIGAQAGATRNITVRAYDTSNNGIQNSITVKVTQ